MLVYLAQDPETKRVAAQQRPFVREDFPRGLRGDGWPQRVYDVPQQTWTKMRRATVSPDVQDHQHRAWWAAAEEG